MLSLLQVPRPLGGRLCLVSSNRLPLFVFSLPGERYEKIFLWPFLVSSDDGLYLAIFVLQQPSASFAKRNERQTAARAEMRGGFKNRLHCETLLHMLWKNWIMMKYDFSQIES